MLHDLIRCLLGTTTINIAVTTTLLERSRVFVHIQPPHVVERAAAQAMNTFAVVGPDDDIA